jgi:hypothetical protein
MSNKSPFEIRLEILKMTAELMQAEYAAAVEFAQDTFDSIKDKTQLGQEQLNKFVPKLFDFADMLAKSKQFYEFVNQK